MDLFARRMTVEELFREEKDGRYGLDPGRIPVGTTTQPNQSLLIVPQALILLIGLGRVS